MVEAKRSLSAYTHLHKWTRPQCYIGAEWHEHYSAGVGQGNPWFGKVKVIEGAAGLLPT
jgi:hypothetical protein